MHYKSALELVKLIYPKDLSSIEPMEETLIRIEAVAFTYPFNVSGHPAGTVRASRQACNLSAQCTEMI